MPYVSPKDTARIRADAAAAALASTLERTGLHDDPATSGSGAEQGRSSSLSEGQGQAASEPTEAADPRSSQHEPPHLTAPIPLHASPLAQHSSPEPSHSPNAPSLISCATDSTNSLRTLSSASNPSDGEMMGTVTEVDVDMDAHGADAPKEEEASSAHIEEHAASQLLTQASPHPHDLAAHADCAELAEVDIDVASPELAQYHREIYEFTMLLYERAKRSDRRRKARAERAASVTGALAAVKA